MGANFQHKVLDGTLYKEDVREAFKAMQEQDRHENGHSYSGGFGMADGLDFHTDAFASSEEAQEYLVTAAEKWGPAVAVTFFDSDQERSMWIIGAWCAS